MGWTTEPERILDLVTYVEYGNDIPATPRPADAQVVHWRGDPTRTPANALPGDFLYIAQETS